jgi:Transcriptional regulator containing PAS, AAA-type ATPase, and DNA-binding domains
MERGGERQDRTKKGFYRSSSLEIRTQGLQPAVLVWDSLLERKRELFAAVREAGEEPWTGEMDCVVQLAQQGDIALIGLGDIGKIANPTLELVAQLKARGVSVLAYENCVEHWPVAAKCRPLLAGACKLLDSSKVEFKTTLVQTLKQMLCARTEARFRSEEAHALMRRYGIIGTSLAINEAFQAATRFSELSDLPVLITGESGTGKELVARAIADMDPKHREGPFVGVNCAAVPVTMAESELFGHRRGAFTGAERERMGWIRAAENGVLFLDEIGEMDLSLQAKLLRVLQEHTVRGLGEDHEVGVRTRFLAATNQNLKELVKQGKFRADLLNRLRVLELVMPNLRQRAGDIELLVKYFVDKHNRLRLHPITGISRDYIEALQELNLPGNIRQLENIVRQSLVHHGQAGELGLDDLPREVLSEIAIRSENLTGVEQASNPTEADDTRRLVQHIVRRAGWNLQITMRECERIICHEALRMAKGNQSQAARLLGITSRSVYNKVHQFGMRA